MKHVLFLLCCIIPSIKGMEGPYQYRLATQIDLEQLIEIINTQAIHESKKIVILPKKFREMALQASINKGRIFIAHDQEKIIGYKKLFLINNEVEKKEILEDEIRAIGPKSNCTYQCTINNDEQLIPGPSLRDPEYTTCLYNGADFTLPAYRGQGVNQQLTNTALISLIPQVIDHIKENKSSAITMLYGITQANAGQKPGDKEDRTIRIHKSFKYFIHALENHTDSVVVSHARYEAFMPTFDPESQELHPLPDAESVPGFGCILTYQLRK